MRNAVEGGPGFFQDIGDVLDQGIDQSFQDALAGVVAGQVRLSFLLENLEDRGIRVTQGDEPIVHENEGHGGAFRLAGIGLGQNSRRHEQGVVLLVQAARNFNVLHLSRSRQINAKRHVQDDFLLLGRLEQVDPDRLAHQGMAMAEVAALNAFLACGMEDNHGRERQSLQAGEVEATPV